MMKKVFLFGLISTLFNFYSNSQTVQQINKCDSAVIELTEKMEGFGPKGNICYGFGSIDGHDSISLSAYPQFKGIPDSITDIKKYCVVLDNFQFYYQNYKNGIYPKDYLLDMASGNKWNLGDTIYLTGSMVRNTISVVAGYNASKAGVYIMDTNGNNDFSDDTLRYLYSNLYNYQDILDNSYYVDCEYFDGKSIKKDKILLNARSSQGESEINLMFSFPELRYGKIKYGNRVYLVCQETYNPERAIYVMEDKPYFISVGDRYQIKPNQYINLGDDYYTYEPGPLTPGVFKIKNANITAEKFNEQIAEKNKKDLARRIPVSNQLGMIAPEISGLDLVNDSAVSLKKYRGKYVFLDFWATYCAPCIIEFPHIKEVYEMFDHAQLEIIGIVLDETKGKIIQFLKDKNVIWPNISMELPTTNITGYKINSYPTTYLIDPDGKIIGVNLRGDDLKTRLELLKVRKNKEL